MREGIDLTGRIDLLLDEIRNSETLLNNARKQISEKKSELKKKENLYYAVRTDRAHLTQAVTEAQDEIADLKEKMKVLTHQFDQMKEEIIAKEQDLIKEVEDKQRILKEKDNLIKDLEKLRLELISSGKEKQDLGKEMKKIQGSNKKLEMEKMALKGEMEKQVSHKELLNIKLADKQIEIDTLKRSCSVQQKVLERGEAKYAEKMEDIRILKLEIRRLRDELDLHCKDGEGLQQMKKERLIKDRELCV
ncbi:cilia- and flagella-associated protein 58 [Eurytemora carolleeae]|uniref:cilia- and flagella-associated protein 58 n=1 Tax=Eurytemora carolleeae TaxID=1294199 RepID=UPI000C78D602|nr:cilia- and flagella-associated protein 58 [Eurytemora carolleeae]|eukprot:XP_023325672.1 cilia- and flagella-associated protein 58-like [Eurytemora affinis]